MKLKLKPCFALVAGFAAAASQGAHVWPESPTSPGVVRQLTKDRDSSESSIVNGAHWSVTGEIGDQYDYWVPAGMTIYCPSAATTFAGKSLTLAGYYPNILYSVTFSHLRLLGGAHVHFSKSNASAPLLGEMTIDSTADNPVVFDMDRTGSAMNSFVFGDSNVLLCGPDSQIDIYHNVNAMRVVPRLGKGDYSVFLGKIRLGRGPASLSQVSDNFIVQVWENWTLPGTLEVGEGVQLWVELASAPLTVGRLNLLSGSTISLRSDYVTITNRLSVSPGTKVLFYGADTPGTGFDPPGRTDWNKGDFILFRLKGDAAAEGNLPDVRNFDLSGMDVGYNYWGAGRLAVETRCGEAALAFYRRLSDIVRVRVS